MTYASSCEPYHLGQKAAPTAEALMRSRYSAFALGNAVYLDRTWHPSTRPPPVMLDPGETWLSLRIIAAREEGDRATVEFIARSRVGGADRSLHEISRFVREGGRWSYVDGLIVDRGGGGA